MFTRILFVASGFVLNFAMGIPREGLSALTFAIFLENFKFIQNGYFSSSRNEISESLFLQLLDVCKARMEVRQQRLRRGRYEMQERRVRDEEEESNRCSSVQARGYKARPTPVRCEAVRLFGPTVLAVRQQQMRGNGHHVQERIVLNQNHPLQR